MPYRDDFYNIGNIIGYSGNLYDNPTVYFHDVAGDAVGHITQAYPDDPRNVGREEVMDLYGMTYEIDNFHVDGEMVCQEKFGGLALHTSRTRFVRLGTSIRSSQPGEVLDMAAFSILATAIRRFPDMKTLPRRR